MSKTIVINGAPLPENSASGEVPPPPRRNIVDLIADEKQWSLYIQAVEYVQKNRKPEDPLSHWAIGAIHGWPMDEEWNGGGKKTERYGYCVHGDARFPTWHRPYVALWEQALQSAAIKIAEGYKTDSAAWAKAAKELRSPFWDWADPKSKYLPPPQVYDAINYSQITITKATGPTKVPNPILAYHFQRAVQFPQPFPPEKTVRHLQDPPNESASVKAFVATVQGEAMASNQAKQIWQTLNWTKTWAEFSNTGTTQGARANSLESLHGAIHNRSGGYGHMSTLEGSGFEPLFMLHHTNVDRYIALWQGLNPEVWITEKIDGPLALRTLNPFWKDVGDFHISIEDKVRNILAFNSLYPEYVGTQGMTAAQIKAHIQKKVDDLYNPSGARQGIPTKIEAPPTRGGGSRGGGPADGLHDLDWFIRVRVKKFSLGQSFTILFFLDSVPDHAHGWRSSETLIGTVGEFVNSSPEACINCGENLDHVDESFIQLDDTLAAHGFAGKSEEEIEGYLKKNLDWRIQKVDGTVVDAADINFLEVAVLTWDVSARDHNVRPVHHNVTAGRAGGREPKN